ncbi:hypothetical protein DLJ53_07680 [Acuticoccus sediminis]|uniref:DUF1326 domain-containing protein n=1 Tax=Acuticoccus sediminis TaxID=2184697 RepID=A0A8B2P2Y9_9HYPH|nr:DUF1326 domain-containing protein [Acuticoccus sediminis]RAI04314.1 hypothetical protein DLJ53_07680 [Acuticoccus sediminis]
MIAWEIHGRELANCNCSYGCPCQFNALPTHGACEAAVGFEIERGHYGDVKLDGLRMASIYKWPGPVHEGNGEMQIIVDESATPEQRDALEKIMTGSDTNDMATMWWIFSAMSPTKHPTLSVPIKTEIDIDGRTGSISVPGVFRITAEPIRNPITGIPHQVRINLPHGFEYETAEIGSGSTTTEGVISLPNNKATYAQFAELHLGNSGVIRAAA